MQRRWNHWSLIVLAAVCIGGTASTHGGTFPVNGNAEYRALKQRLQAAVFLSHATFGPTTAEIDALAARIAEIGRKPAFLEWIENQFALPATYQKDLSEQMVLDDGFETTQSGIGVSRYRHYAWWHNAITAEDQLRQRMAWALIQIFVVADSGAAFNSQTADASGQAYWLGMGDYYDMLLEHSFGNYIDVLTDVTCHPIMGVYLSHVKNRKANPAIGRYPDENYGREVMQLLSIGIHKRKINGVIVQENGEPVETYDNEMIKTMARVFTGFTYAGSNTFFAPRNYNEPMQMWDAEHDTDEKVLFNGTVLSAGQTGMDDVNGALQNLFEHDNCPPFIARLLIQRLVRSNPQKGYIKAVARAFVDNGSGVRGDFKAVLTRILMHRQAINSLVFQKVRDDNGNVVGLHVEPKGTEFTRLREPVLRYAAMIRAFNPTNDYATGRFMIPSQNSNMDQAPYQAPHVFNFYEPDYIPPGGILSYVPSRQIPNGILVAPEFEILTSVIANRFANRLRSDIRDAKLDFTLLNNSNGTFTTDILLDFSTEEALAADPAALVDHLSLLLCNGSLDDTSKEILAAAIEEETTNNLNRAKGAILATLTSPACAVGE